MKEPPQGMTPPTQSVVKKAPHQPSRLRKFVAKNSAGLRIRAHPSLQSEQIGIVHVNGTIAFIDEVSAHQFVCGMLVIWKRKLHKTRTSHTSSESLQLANHHHMPELNYSMQLQKCIAVNNFALTLPDNGRIIFQNIQANLMSILVNTKV